MNSIRELLNHYKALKQREQSKQAINHIESVIVLLERQIRIEAIHQAQMDQLKHEIFNRDQNINFLNKRNRVLFDLCKREGYFTNY